MAELVIKIPEDTYKNIREYYEKNDTVEAIYSYIYHGTPLPPHGRLIDADKLWDSYHDLDYDFYEAFDLVDTIIEADTAGKEQE